MQVLQTFQPAPTDSSSILVLVQPIAVQEYQKVWVILDIRRNRIASMWAEQTRQKLRGGSGDGQIFWAMVMHAVGGRWKAPSNEGGLKTAHKILRHGNGGSRPAKRPIKIRYIRNGFEETRASVFCLSESDEQVHSLKNSLRFFLLKFQRKFWLDIFFYLYRNGNSPNQFGGRARRKEGLEKLFWVEEIQQVVPNPSTSLTLNNKFLNFPPSKLEIFWQSWLNASFLELKLEAWFRRSRTLSACLSIINVASFLVFPIPSFVAIFSGSRIHCCDHDANAAPAGCIRSIVWKPWVEIL